MLAYYSKSDVPLQRGLEGKPVERGVEAELLLFQVSFYIIVNKKKKARHLNLRMYVIQVTALAELWPSDMSVHCSCWSSAGWNHCWLLLESIHRVFENTN